MWGTPVDNLQTAIKWASLGIPVFPCHSSDGWKDGKEISMKAPIPPHGFKQSTTDPEAIKLWWTENPEDLVGLYVGTELVVLDIDVSTEKNKDGWYGLEQHGLTPPETFNVITRSGGSHYFYRNPNGLKLGPTVGVKLPDGQVIEDVDRRAGGSYVIAWSESVPASLGELAPLPDWLAVPAGNYAEKGFSGSTEEWFKNLKKGLPTPLVVYVKKKFPLDDINHQQLLSITANLVSLGSSGEAGVEEAIAQFKALYLKEPYNQTKYQKAFDNALEGAIKKYGGSSQMTPEEERQSKIDLKVEELEIRMEAERIVGSKNFEGSKVLTWDDLAEADRVEIVGSLVPWQGLSMLVGDSNIGKTFCYLDMCCRIALGQPWLGKPTQKVKILLVLGEGKSGFLSRFEYWCEYYGYDIELIKPWFFFIDGGNLNSDQSIDLIREHAKANDCQLVVYDTWAANSGLANENDAALTAMTVSRMLAKMPTLSHLVIHHPTKESGKKTAPNPRGSGALPAAADVVMVLFYDKEAKKTLGATHTWVALSTETSHNGKNRNAQTETIRGLRLKEFAPTKLVWFHEDTTKTKKSVANVKKHLKPNMTVKEYALAADVSPTTAQRELTEAVEMGLVVASVPKAKNQGVKYSPAVLKDPAIAADSNWAELVANAEDSY
jgi:hypothetical protein